MKTYTVCCKLVTTPTTAEALKETSQRFADACNYLLKASIDQKTSNAITLHKLCYAKVREIFELSANLTVRAIRRVCAMRTRLKGKRKSPKLFKPKSIDYDARIFSYKQQDETISLTTTRGRIKCSLNLGKYQQRALIDQNPTSATVINKAGVWYIHIIIEREAGECPGNNVMGIDLGINNIAVASTGLKVEGKSRRAFKAKCCRVRASLQSKGTKGAKKLLKKLSGYESRRIIHENHVVSKHIVDEAKRHTCGIIRMEQLKDIRAKTKTWNKHRNRMVAGWSFYQLQQFVSYKAAFAGIAVELINPAYTSQTCCHCLKLGSRREELFTCLTCGDEHADVNASHVIALGGVVCKPARISNAS